MLIRLMGMPSMVRSGGLSLVDGVVVLLVGLLAESLLVSIGLGCEWMGILVVVVGMLVTAGLAMAGFAT